MDCAGENSSCLFELVEYLCQMDTGHCGWRAVVQKYLLPLEWTDQGQSNSKGIAKEYEMGMLLPSIPSSSFQTNKTK